MKFAAAGYEYPAAWEQLDLVPDDVDVLKLDPYFDFPAGLCIHMNTYIYICIYIYIYIYNIHIHV